MSNAGRPTFTPARGSATQGGNKFFAPTHAYSSRDLPAHKTLKTRFLNSFFCLHFILNFYIIKHIFLISYFIDKLVRIQKTNSPLVISKSNLKRKRRKEFGVLLRLQMKVCIFFSMLFEADWELIRPFCPSQLQNGSLR